MAARSRNSAKRNKKLSANATEQEIKDYYAACAQVEIEPSDTLRKLAHALVLHVQEVGHVTFPLRFSGAKKQN